MNDQDITREAAPERGNPYARAYSRLSPEGKAKFSAALGRLGEAISKAVREAKRDPAAAQ